MNDLPEQPPITLEQLDKDLLFVEVEMADARDLGKAIHTIMFNLILEMHNNGLINAPVFCSKLMKLVPKMEPAGAQIALNLILSEIMSKIPDDDLSA